MTKSTCPCEQIYASATSMGSASTISGDLVTANATATASSAVSYTEALSLATAEAIQLADNYAQHDANIIDQTLTIVQSRSLIPSTTGITVGSKTAPYSQVYTAKGVVLSSNSIGNEVILTGSKDKLYANGAQVYTSANPQGSSGDDTFYGTNSGGTGTGTGTGNSGFGGDTLLQLTSGSNNTAVGYAALATNTSSSYNTAIGYSADVSTDTLTNCTSVGNGAICNASNQITLGNDSVTSLVCSGSATLNGVTLGKGAGGLHQIWQSAQMHFQTIQMVVLI